MRVRGRRRKATLTAIGLVTALALAGCGGMTEDNASTAQDAPARDAAGAGPGAPEAAAEAPPADTPVEFRLDERAIIYTGSITLRVENVDTAAGQATSIATAAGGFVGADERTSNNRRSRATLELRVPAPKFNTIVDDLAGIGEQEQRDINAQDVTEEVLDLDARLASQRARVESGRRLLAEADSLTELVMLEQELAKREADLASLEAKKRKMSDLTTLSTITVVLLGPEAVRDSGEKLGFVQGLKAGWETFVSSMVVLVTVLGAVLPWLIVLGLPVVAWVVLARRARRRRGPRGPIAGGPGRPVPGGGPWPGGPGDRAPAAPAPAMAGAAVRLPEPRLPSTGASAKPAAAEPATPTSPPAPGSPPPPDSPRVPPS